MEHLADTYEWGRALLLLLKAGGWEIYERPALAGGVLLIAEHGPYEMRATGVTLAEAALPLFEQCSRLTRLPETQLHLFAA